MSLYESAISGLGDELFGALRQRRTLTPLTGHHPGITIDDAYRISLHMLRRREMEGESIIGNKIGVTSKPVQDMLNLHQSDFGFLHDKIPCADDATRDVVEQVNDWIQRALIMPDVTEKLAANCLISIPSSP